MSDKMCREFLDWLERLPRRELSPAFQRHLEVCENCRKQFSQFDPIISKLESAKSPKELSANKLDELTEVAQHAASQRENRRLAFRLSLISLLCLPLIISVNWLWASLGFNLLASHVSRIFAYVFLGTFIGSAAGMSGLLYGSIPLLAGKIRKQPGKEITT